MDLQKETYHGGSWSGGPWWSTLLKAVKADTSWEKRWRADSRDFCGFSIEGGGVCAGVGECGCR